MKAIQIKYLGPTNTKGARLKAYTEAGALIESRSYEDNADVQARKLASKYIKAKGWDNCRVTGFGGLPNGDYVATIGSVG